MGYAVAMADLNDVAVFVKVVERGGFAAAARELGVPTSTVSRTLARLEASLGVRLVHRTTRNVRPTNDGQRLYEEAASAVATLASATRRAAHSTHELRGLLRVTAPNDLAEAFVGEAVAAFAALHPVLELELVLTTRVVNLIEENIDLALRAGALRDSSLIARRIGSTELRLYASPDYLARRGVPRRPSELAKHELVLFRARDGRTHWKLERGRRSLDLEVSGRIRGDDFGFVHAVALAGGGIALMPRTLAVRAVAEGRLVQVLPGWENRGGALFAVYPSTKFVPRKVALFRDFVARRFAEHPGWQPGLRRG